uniref:Uncharacterized protein n=1 Tax=Romanomermis culicivorax TaxID=13658 RepID=A0A915HJM0_ROMCU
MELVNRNLTINMKIAAPIFNFFDPKSKSIASINLAMENWLPVGKNMADRCREQRNILKWRFPIVRIGKNGYMENSAIFLACTSDGIEVASQDIGKAFNIHFITDSHMYYEIGSIKFIDYIACYPQNVGFYDHCVYAGAHQ